MNIIANALHEDNCNYKYSDAHDEKGGKQVQYRTGDGNHHAPDAAKKFDHPKDPQDLSHPEKPGDPGDSEEGR
jgi:hypothetical protein